MLAVLHEVPDIFHKVDGVLGSFVTVMVELVQEVGVGTIVLTVGYGREVVMCQKTVGDVCGRAVGCGGVVAILDEVFKQGKYQGAAGVF